MKKKITIILGLVAICFMTGCSKTPELSYTGEDILYTCTDEQVALFKDDVNVKIAEKQGFIYIDSNDIRDEYTDGVLEFNEDNKVDVKECYFISYKEITDNKFGSKSAIAHKDPVEGSMKISISGNYSYKVSNSLTYMQSDMTSEQLTNYISIQLNAIYVMNMKDKTYSELSQEKEFDETKMNSINASVSKYGLEVTKVNVETVEKK